MENRDEAIVNLEHILKRLKGIEEYGLEAEVIIFALKAMKENPNLTIIEAFEVGCDEWDV